MTEIRDIEKVTYNGRQVKTFEAWKVLRDKAIYAGSFYAPVRTANKDLLWYIKDEFGYTE